MPKPKASEVELSSVKRAHILKESASVDPSIEEKGKTKAEAATWSRLDRLD